MEDNKSNIDMYLHNSQLIYGCSLNPEYGMSVIQKYSAWELFKYKKCNKLVWNLGVVFILSILSALIGLAFLTIGFISGESIIWSILGGASIVMFWLYKWDYWSR